MTTLRETLAEHGYDGGWRCSCGWTGSFDEWAAHLESVALAWVGARLAGADVLEGVADALDDEQSWSPSGISSAAAAALTAIRDALGVPVAPNSEPVDPNPTSALAAEFDRSNDTDGIPCEACPFAGCDNCEAEAARRANGEAK